jgi:hypothetical protein
MDVQGGGGSIQTAGDPPQGDDYVGLLSSKELQVILHNIIEIHHHIGRDDNKSNKKARAGGGTSNDYDDQSDDSDVEVDSDSDDLHGDQSNKRKVSFFCMYVKLGSKTRSRKFKYKNIEDAEADRLNLCFLSSEEGRKEYYRKKLQPFYQRLENSKCFSNSSEFISRRNAYLKRLLEDKQETDIFATLNADCMDNINSLHNIFGGEDLDAFESLSNMTCMTDFEGVIIGGCGPSLIYNVEISSEDSHVRLCRNDDEVLTVMKYCPETHYFYAGSDKGIMYCIPVIGKELKFNECKIKQVSNEGVSGIYFYDKKMIS